MRKEDLSSHTPQAQIHHLPLCGLNARWWGNSLCAPLFMQKVNKPNFASSCDAFRKSPLKKTLLVMSPYQGLVLYMAHFISLCSVKQIPNAVAYLFGNLWFLGK